jgi:queuine tRNA-ribosyltransferase
MLAARLCTHHNLHFYLKLVGGAREAILAGRFMQWRAEFYEAYRSGPQ